MLIRSCVSVVIHISGTFLSFGACAVYICDHTLIGAHKIAPCTYLVGKVEPCGQESGFVSYVAKLNSLDRRNKISNLVIVRCVHNIYLINAVFS